MASIEGVVRLSGAELLAKYDEREPEIEHAGARYQLRSLAGMLGTPELVLEDTQTLRPVVLIYSGDQRVALQVDLVVGSREVVVKPLGPQLSSLSGISGATILGDGRVVLILDVLGLVRKVRGVPVLCRSNEPESSGEVDRPFTVMVVDDSITIRKVTARVLQRNHYNVMTAKDGVDAVGQLADAVPDLMLLDIEMPRMDGFELAMHVRSDERLRDVPIVMITSRTGEKHRQRAMDIGVNRYLGKPYQENELLQLITELLPSA
jgi:chemosensory pili system protein ChpA (sensor histidine kinase/response regulator)